MRLNRCSLFGSLAFLALASSQALAQTWQYDGVFNRHQPLGYSRCGELDIAAIVRVKKISFAHRNHSDGRTAMLKDIAVSVMDGQGVRKGETLCVVWPSGPAGYIPEVNETCLLFAQKPKDGKLIEPFMPTLEPSRDLIAEPGDVTGLMLFPTSSTRLVRSEDSADMLIRNIATCLSSTNATAVWRARNFFALNGYPGGGSNTDYFGVEPRGLPTELIQIARTMRPASAVVVYDLLARWHVNGIQESYVEALLEAGQNPDRLGDFYKLGFEPTWRVEYETQGLVQKGLPPVQRLWTGKIWASKLARCLDAGAVNTCIMMSNYSGASVADMRPLLPRLSQKDVPNGIHSFVAANLRRSDLILSEETPDSKEQKRAALEQALRDALGALK